jgi:arylsulfatase A-like enzyme
MQSRQGRQYARFTEWKYDRDYDVQMATYHQQVYGIDAAVGMIREALSANGVANNTIVIYTSDNGFLCGSHGYGSKVLPYEESARVPLIMFDPRHTNSGKQLRCRALTGNIDFAPTILELAGLDIPAGMDGRSLLSLYDDPAGDIRESLALINVWGPVPVHSLGVVTKDWKYIYWPHSDEGFVPTEELYHTADDPLERTNLIADKTVLSHLNEMRSVYSGAVRHWRSEAVPYHNYQPFADLFDRDK